MAEKKTKPQTRTPGRPSGLVLPERQERKPEENPMRDTIRAAMAETGTTRVTPVSPVARVSQEAAPKRDFTRTANSIVREAVPAGLFTGKGKQLYDFLYSQTRGAIVPARSVRLPRESVMRGANMSRPTYRTQLSRLVAVGLVKVEEMGGDHSGNLFTVYLPEEAANPGYPGSPTYPGNSGKEFDGQPGKESYPGNTGLSVDSQRTSGESQTLIQDLKNNDDEAYAEFLALLKQTVKELTDKEALASESARWREVAEVLMTELRIAAGRTTVSSVPAFLAEHLRRRLWKKEKREIEREAAESAAQGQQAQRVTIPEGVICPDCFNTGMYYPEGFDKGVARCEHKALQTDSADAP